MATRVLGVDPGLTRCGIGVVDVEAGRRASLVFFGVVTSASDDAIDQRLLQIADGIQAAMEAHEPDAVAVERVFAQHNLRTVMGTAQASGLALLAAARAGLPVSMHTPSEVKAAVTGSGSADKRQVQAMVQRILRLDAPPTPADAADALALAICSAWRGGAASPVPNAAGAATLTPAQRAWAAAERAGARPRR